MSKVWFIQNNVGSAAHNASSDICVELCAQILTMMLCTWAGIIRGVDIQKGLLYLITPVPLQRLQCVDLLQQGLIEIPTALLQVTPCPPPPFFWLLASPPNRLGFLQKGRTRFCQGDQ
jgi:hypothetical protein